MLFKIVGPIKVHRDKEQAQFRRDLINWYGVSPGGTQIWCPVLQTWGKSRKAAYMVQYALGYQTTGDGFGEPGNG
jgi:hypothetical protein